MISYKLLNTLITPDARTEAATTHELNTPRLPETTPEIKIENEFARPPQSNAAHEPPPPVGGRMATDPNRGIEPRLAPHDGKMTHPASNLVGALEPPRGGGVFDGRASAL